MQPTRVWCRGVETDLTRHPAPLRLERLVGGAGAWEVEIGFGKGRYLLDRCAADPERRFLGIEIASPYYRLARDRAAKRALDNLVLIRGEAVYLMSTALDTAWAEAAHVYFPDPWPKDRHHKRRLFDPETVDLVLGVLRPGGRLYFASDHPDYGPLVRDLLRRHPAVELEIVDGDWPDGARTNYEAKFVAQGRPITRLVATRRTDHEGDLLHPAGRVGVLAATRPGGDGGTAEARP